MIKFTKIVALSLLAGMPLLLSSVSATFAASQSKPAIVVELFTSQGCSSCPSADRFLSELVEHDNVIALTEAVDYWDYLGWKDANARPEHTERQQNYARARGDRTIYTPQMVLNGRVHVVGSRRQEVVRQIGRLADGPGRLTIPIDLSVKQDSLQIDVAGQKAGSEQGSAPDGTLYLMFYKKSVAADIKSGENRGRKITYHNVVQDMRSVGMWHGKAVSIELPMSEVRKQGYDGFAVLLQSDLSGLPGPVFGAAKLEF